MKRKREEGFTLIELLIVVVIIGILAAVAIPQFTATRERAFDAAAQSDARNMMTAQEIYFSAQQVYWGGNVAAGGSTDMNDVADFQASRGVSLTVTLAADSMSYTITAEHASSSNTWCVNTSPDAARTGQVHQADEC